MSAPSRIPVAVFLILGVLVSCATPDDPVSTTVVSPAPEPVQPPASEPNRYEGTIAAPAFPGGLDWINATRPVTWEDLSGKIVVIDFWTYGCINCIHMIPVLERLQETFRDELVILGVHSAKFENEGNTGNIRQIARRYGRTEAIVNDRDFRIWRAWGVRAWPTIAVVDPRGNVLGIQSGELPYEALAAFVGNVEARFDELGLINRSPVPILETETLPAASLLLYPGKVLADPDGGRLFIADSNHHRIVVTEIGTGTVVDVIGSGSSGFVDGDFDSARLHTPQGMALAGNTLFIADLDNHAIREADLLNRSVRTIAGTGIRGSGRPPSGSLDPLLHDLRSPWDVEIVGDDLFIAMAGTHQIWSFNTIEQTLQVAVGNGREALINRDLLGSELAQPSGLHHVDGLLYFADSESSSIRVADLNTGQVRTVAGPDENTLFDFGDVDGFVGDSRLQHPLGVTGGPDGIIFIVDTYNSRIKAISDDFTLTVFGRGGDGGYRDGGPEIAEFDEPGGLDYADGKIYVADTNNHAVRVIDLQTGTVDTLVLQNVASLARPDSSVTLLADTTPAGLSFVLDNQRVSAGQGSVNLAIVLPENYKLNPLVASSYTLSLPATGVVRISPDAVGGELSETSLVIPAEFAAGEASLRIRLSLYYCETSNEQVCILDDSEVVVPVTVANRDMGGDEANGNAVRILRKVELPELPTFGSF